MLDRCVFTGPFAKPSLNAFARTKLLRRPGRRRTYLLNYAVQQQNPLAAGNTKKRAAGSVLARVGTVSFGAPSVVAHEGAAKEGAETEEFSYKIGSLNGVVSQGHATFRPTRRYFRFEQRWYVIPEKYDALSEDELSRRMKIKIRNTGKTPWNLGRKWTPGKQVKASETAEEYVCAESIEHIKAGTRKAMQRQDVKDHYWKKMSVRLSMARASAKKRQLARQKKLAEMPKVPRKRRSPVKKAVPKETAPKTAKGSTTPASPVITDERRQKISEAIRKKWRDPEYRARVSQGRKNEQSNAAGMKVADDACREKYDALMETIMKLTDEINALEAQKILVLADAEAVREIDEALECSRELIERVRVAVREVEERLGIQTSPLDTVLSPSTAVITNGAC